MCSVVSVIVQGRTRAVPFPVSDGSGFQLDFILDWCVKVTVVNRRRKESKIILRTTWSFVVELGFELFAFSHFAHRFGKVVFLDLITFCSNGEHTY